MRNRIDCSGDICDAENSIEIYPQKCHTFPCYPCAYLENSRIYMVIISMVYVHLFSRINTDL